MNAFRLKIYAAERPLFDGECESLIVPTVEGLYGVMARHSDLVALLTEGELRYREPGKKDFECLAVTRGLMTVEKGEATVITEAAERAKEIDFPRAMKQYQNAKEGLKTDDKVAGQLAQMKLSRALNRLEVSSAHKDE